MRSAASIALVVVVAAWACVLESPGPNQNAHLASVTAFAHDTPRIDRYHNWTRDTAWIGGHYYAAKAPGLALFALPWYEGLRATGLLVHGPPPSVPWPRAEELGMPLTAPWEMALYGAALPCLLVLLLVRSVADGLVPGFGGRAALVLGAGTLVGVFATLFFEHELSTLLGFLAYALVFHARRRGAGRGPLLAAGIAAGLALGVEFPLAIVAVLVGVYALGRTDRLRRGLAYAAGVALGVAPLAAYNLWTFGSIASTAYSHAVLEPGRSGHDVVGANSSGFFGIGAPSPSAFVALLLQPKGLLVLSPVLAVAAAGLVSLWRRGGRADAALAGGVTLGFLLYDCAYYLPFGGFNGGPRFLVPALPFLALGIAAAWRAWPGPTLALACASVVVTTASILSDPMLVSEDVGTMVHRLERGGDQNGPLPSTVLHWVWGARLAPLLLLGAIVLATVAVAVARDALRLRRRDVALGLAALVAWRIAYAGGSVLARAPDGWIAAALLALGLTAAFALLLHGRLRAAAPGVLLLPLLWPHFAGATWPSLALVSVALVAIAAAARLTGGAAPGAASRAAGS